MMRIGLVTYEYPPQAGVGGVGTYFYALARALGRAGHQVHVLAGPTDRGEQPLHNVTVHRIPARYDPPIRLLRFAYWKIAAPLLQKHNPWVWHWLRWDLATPAALAEIDRRHPLDVVEAVEHAGNALLVGRMKRWPLVLRIEGPWDLFYGMNRTQGTVLNRMLSWMESTSARHAQYITTPSHAMSTLLQRKWRVEPYPRVVPNFLDIPAERAPLPPADGPQRIVCAGRLEVFKGQDTLVKAFALVGREFPKAELVLIGPDQWSHRYTFAQLVEKLVPDAAVRARIKLTGPLPRDVVQDELRRAAVAVVASSGFESFSFSTLEAMAAARPTVGTRFGAVPELLDAGGAGLLFSPGDERELADQIARLLSDRDLSQRMATAAHERARSTFDSSAVLPLALDTYYRAIEDFNRTSRSPRPLPALDPMLSIAPGMRSSPGVAV